MKSALRVSAHVLMVGALVATAACSRTKSPAGKGSADLDNIGKPVQTGAERKEPTTTTRLDVNGVVSNPNLSSEQKAEELAKAAEQLLSAQGFIYANQIADLALEQNPLNFRARFIKALLAPVLVQKGIVTRIAPLAAKEGKLHEKYAGLLARVHSKLPISNLKTFLLETGPEISTEEQLQAHLDQTAQGFKVLRDFLRTNKPNQFEMTVSDTLAAPLLRRLKRACNISESAPLDFFMECPTEVVRLEVLLNRGDFEAIQQAAAGAEVGIMIGNSYDISGAISVAQAHANERIESLNAIELLDEALRAEKFATLREEKEGFTRLKQMGSEALSGVNWILENRMLACSLGAQDSLNRLATILDEDLCAHLETSRAAELRDKVAKSIAGETIQVPLTFFKNYQASAEIRPSAWMESPIRDLRTQKPNFNNCGRLESFKDQTFGGLVPAGNANSFILKNCE